VSDREKILIKYHSDKIEKLRYIDGKSDWVDLRVAEEVSLKKGDFKLIDLGISVKLPEGYEMLVVARSSTFKNFGLIQTNALGVVDESYCGDDDRIMMPVWATKDVDIHINDRLCQFRILKHQPALEFTETDKLSGISRGGFGSTGIN
jgi:dUTP pyrophosphatase